MGVTFCLDERSETCHVLVQTFRHNSPVYTVRGTHELVITRYKSSVYLKRWSRKDEKSKLWADLVFQTWEGEYLIHHMVERVRRLPEALPITDMCRRSGTILLCVLESESSQPFYSCIGPRRVQF